jgi:integration host factor subunit alpha
MSRKTLTRADLATALVQEVGLPHNQSSELVEDVLEHIANGMDKDGRVVITNFGSFNVRHKEERIGRNPKTGGEAVVSARRSVVFKASETMKRKVPGAMRKAGSVFTR